VNPNDDPGADPIDTSSPPPQTGGLDPTLILVDPDAASGGGGTGTPKTDIAPIDHVPGWQPELNGPGSGPSVGSGGDMSRGQWP